MARTETPAEERFIVVYQFMRKSLGLTGVTLNIFARIYGFCHDGTSEFYESRSNTAEFMGTTARTVTRSCGRICTSRRARLHAHEHRWPASPRAAARRRR